MDPVTLIVSALVLGASAGLKEAATSAVRDTYSALKRVIAGRYATVDVTPLENKPESKAKQASLEEDLREKNAGDDPELIDAARRVVDAVEANDGTAAAAIGVDLGRVKAEFVRINSVRAEGTGVRAGDIETRGGVEISGITAGAVAPGDPRRP